MRRQYGNRGQATKTGMMSLLLMLGNQVRQMDQKPPITLFLVAGKLLLEQSVVETSKHQIYMCVAVQVLLFAAPQELAAFIPSISNACLHPYRVLEVSRPGMYCACALQSHEQCCRE